MNAEVTPAIRKWLRQNTSGFLLVDTAHPDKSLGSNGTSKILAKVGMRKFHKRLGSSLLRHSYLTHKYGEDQKQKEKDADIMGHSLQMQNDYIKSN